MSGCIIKCPKCGKGHMKPMQNMSGGKKMLKSTAIIDEKYSKRASEFRVSGLICGCCGYISSW